MNRTWMSRVLAGAVGWLALGVGAWAETEWRSGATDRTDVRETRPGVRTETRIKEDRSWQPRDERGRWIRMREGERDKTRTTAREDWTDSGWEAEAGLSRDLKTYSEAKRGNTESMARELGKTSLEKGKTTWDGGLGPSYKRQFKGDAGTATVTAHAGMKGKARWGDNGVDASGQIGIEAAVRATTAKWKAGGENIGASLHGSGKLELGVLAKAKFGAYVDEKGITLGAEASVGAYAKGEVKVNFEAHVFGVRTNVNLVASGYAGALAEGKAVVTLGWNGKVKFMAGIGASLGLGGGVSVEFELDAEELMKRLNLDSIEDLLTWLKAFQENPYPHLARLGLQALRKVHEAGFGVVRKLGEDAAQIFETYVVKPMQAARSVIQEGVKKGLAFLGRMVRSRQVDPPESALNICLASASDAVATLPAIGERLESMAFPLCMAGETDMADWSSWDGMGEAEWYLFDWPAAFRWPSL